MKNSASDSGPILVPVDFSPDSARAVVHAAGQAVHEGRDLVILHVIHDPADAPGFYAGKGKAKKHLRRLEDVAAEMMAEFLDGLRREHPKLKPLIKAETRLVSGLPVPRILDVVRELNPGNVVMGSRGRGTLSRLLTGSKTEQCLRLCPVPVTVVRETD